MPPPEHAQEVLLVVFREVGGFDRRGPGALRFDELEIGYCKHMPALAVDLLSDRQEREKVQKRVNRFLKDSVAMARLSKLR